MKHLLSGMLLAFVAFFVLASNEAGAPYAISRSAAAPPQSESAGAALHDPRRHSGSGGIV